MNIDDKKNLDVLQRILPNLDTELVVSEEESNNNRRLAVRYLRDDIILIVKQQGLLQLKILPQVKLLDISSKGAYICSSVKITLKRKLILIFSFKSGKQFRIEGKAIYNNPNDTFCYGIQFNKFEHALGDYLVESQHQLIFK